MGGGNRNTKGSRHKQSNCTAGIGAEATGLVEFGDAVTHGLYDTPTAEHGTEAHRRVARKYDPAGNGIGGLGYTRSDQQHPDDADGFLRIIAAVSKAIGRSRQQLETPEVFIDLAWRHVSANPRNGHHQGTTNHKAEKRRHEDEGDDFQNTGRDQAADTRFGHGCADQTTDQGVRGRRRNAVVPGNDVPDNGADQRTEDDVMIDDRGIDGAFADSQGHLEREQEIGKKIECRGPDNGLMRLENPG
eukprot:TRINITY_DN5135_c0_g1_i20.p5 TRINITY_DN5135_c0_g1~~TRINITY_DN5135_c0_g1_i20.p5  ORF type:complete len:245 (-),score=24.37 TRINITY_DN5135_c0_g1_i20:2477-3211(-)